eukprot:TRINITY_DN12496_c0_g6_i1.p1 TRINITY_DN12496_c0_g6~~TRINITY_DN12496_c0_g6_i1.p1  ORF type:complete len:100 (+),score=8.35 TRINITY_DN12496_c0_g6_i1:842-1141(+)
MQRSGEELSQRAGVRLKMNANQDVPISITRPTITTGQSRIPPSDEITANYLISGLHICTLSDQHLGYSLTTALACQMQWCGVVLHDSFQRQTSKKPPPA